MTLATTTTKQALFTHLMTAQKPKRKPTTWRMPLGVYEARWQSQDIWIIGHCSIAASQGKFACLLTHLYRCSVGCWVQCRCRMGVAGHQSHRCRGRHSGGAAAGCHDHRPSRQGGRPVAAAAAAGHQTHGRQNRHHARGLQWGQRPHLSARLHSRARKRLLSAARLGRSAAAGVAAGAGAAGAAAAALNPSRGAAAPGGRDHWGGHCRCSPARRQSRHPRVAIRCDPHGRCSAQARRPTRARWAAGAPRWAAQGPLAATAAAGQTPPASSKQASPRSGGRTAAGAPRWDPGDRTHACRHRGACCRHICAQQSMIL